MGKKSAKKKAGNKKVEKKVVKSRRDKQRKFLYEIGLFVVEFEDVQKKVKQLLIDCFEFEELKDQNLIEIILYQATSYNLTEYFRGITLYQVSKIEMMYISTEEKKKIELLKKYIKIANENLQEAATFRNDLLHANYDNRTVINWKNNNNFKILTKFQGQRSKIKSKGIELNQISIDPNVFKKVINMMIKLKFLIYLISNLINKDFFKTFKMDDNALKVYDDLDIKGEREKLFEVANNYYQKQYTFRRDMKGREEYYRAVANGEIEGGA